MKEKNKISSKVVVIITLLVAIAIAAFVVLNNSNGPDTSIKFDKQPPIEGRPILGDPNAPVTVVEFGDFKCPSCKVWSEQYFPQLIEDYVDQGDVKFSYVNVFFHGEESVLGAAAAEAVFKQQPESYWAFNKELFRAQPSEADHDSLWITMDKIKEVASLIPGIDIEQLQQDMGDDSVVEQLQKDLHLTQEFEVKLTPSIMVNDTMLKDPFDYEAIKKLIDDALAGKDE